MAEANAPTTSFAALTNEQKTIFVLLVFFAVCVVGLGILQIRTTMYAPFALTSAVPSAIKEDINSVDALRFRDTDHDTLSDFDELYVYGTSPYLYDTFGYGMSDKEVITKGLPLCPKGQDCSSVAGSASGVPQTSASSTVLGGADAAVGKAPEDLTTLLSSPDKIRSLLLQSGVRPEVLSKISDKDLMDLVAQTMSSSSTQLDPKALQLLNQSGVKTNTP